MIVILQKDIISWVQFSNFLFLNINIWIKPILFYKTNLVIFWIASLKKKLYNW